MRKSETPVQSIERLMKYEAEWREAIRLVKEALVESEPLAETGEPLNECACGFTDAPSSASLGKRDLLETLDIVEDIVRRHCTENFEAGEIVRRIRALVSQGRDDG